MMKFFLYLLLLGMFLPASSGAVNAQDGGLSEMMCTEAASAVDRGNAGATATQVADRLESVRPKESSDTEGTGSVK